MYKKKSLNLDVGQMMKREGEQYQCLDQKIHPCQNAKLSFKNPEESFITWTNF